MTDAETHPASRDQPHERHPEADTAVHPRISHAHLLGIVARLPSDYSDYGGAVERWADADGAYPDCSCGCLWAAWLAGTLGGDWCVCTNPHAPRRALLTFEHQTGADCFVAADTQENL
jgi:hypothetical protein